MTQLSKSQQDVHELLMAGLNGLVNGEVEPWLDMFTDDGAMEFPYALEGMPKRIEGREALANHLVRFPDRFDFSSFSDPTFHYSTNPEVMIAEFSCQAQVLSTGRPYNQSYVSVITIRDGKIANYRDYWNPLVALQALGGEDALLSFTADEG